MLISIGLIKINYSFKTNIISLFYKREKNEVVNKNLKNVWICQYIKKVTQNQIDKSNKINMKIKPIN